MILNWYAFSLTVSYKLSKSKEGSEGEQILFFMALLMAGGENIYWKQNPDIVILEQVSDFPLKQGVVLLILHGQLANVMIQKLISDNQKFILDLQVFSNLMKIILHHS